MERRPGHRLDGPERAKALLKHALELNPAHPNSHRLLGILAARQGHTSHALISWLMYLAIEPNGGYSQSILVNLERLAQNVPVMEPKDMLTTAAARTDMCIAFYVDGGDPTKGDDVKETIAETPQGFMATADSSPNCTLEQLMPTSGSPSRFTSDGA